MTRYQRQLAIPDFTVEMQKRLTLSSVLVVGAGGLASGCLPYLCGAGIGQIIIADGDVVEQSNLHRQILFREEDIGKNKAECAAQHLNSLNSEVSIRSIPFFLNEGNEALIPENSQLVIDCSDRMETKYFLNDYCSARKIPFISASNFQWEGQLFILSNQYPTINIRSVFASPAKNITTCNETGALGPILGMLGAAQALEAMRILSSCQPIIDELVYFDYKTYKVQRLSIPEVEYQGKEANLIELSNEEFDTKLNNNEVMLVDVRQRDEKPVSPFPCMNVPINELESQLTDWNKTQEIVFFCHSGIRSAHAVELLQEKGFSRVSHLRGGLVRYSPTTVKL